MEFYNKLNFEKAVENLELLYLINVNMKNIIRYIPVDSYDDSDDVSVEVYVDEPGVTEGVVSEITVLTDGEV